MRLAPSAARPVLCSVRPAPVSRPPARCISGAERPSAPQGPFRLPSQRGAKPSPARSKLLRVALPDAPSYRRPHDPTVKPVLPTTPLDPVLIPAGPARTEIERLLSTQRVDAALEVFRTLPKSPALYGHFINHLLDRNHFHASAAFELYEEMVAQNFTPTAQTFAALIRACLAISPPHVTKAEQLHQRALAIHTDPNEAVHVNVALLSVLTNAGAQNGRKVGSLCEEIEPHCASLHTRELDHLVKGYARLGRMEEAERHYRHYLDKKVFPSNTALGAMIDMYGLAQRPQDAIRVYTDTKALGMNMPASAVLRLLKICGQAKMLEDARKFYGTVNPRNSLHEEAMFQMVELYLRNGKVADALDVLNATHASMTPRTAEYLFRHIAAARLGSLGVQFALSVFNKLENSTRLAGKRRVYDAFLDVAAAGSDPVVAERVWREMTKYKVHPTPANYAALLECTKDVKRIAQLLAELERKQVRLVDRLRVAVRRATKLLEDDGIVQKEKEARLAEAAASKAHNP